MAGRVDDVPRVEHAMDAVMTLTDVATRLGDRAGLVAFDRTVRAVVPPAHGRAPSSVRVTEAMYQLEPALAESDYRGAFTETLRPVPPARDARHPHRPRRAGGGRELAAGVAAHHAQPRRGRRGVQDPEVVQWASMDVRDRSRRVSQAAAVSTLDERRRTAARLRGLGATVVDARARSHGRRLADAYLEVKATGAL